MDRFPADIDSNSRLCDLTVSQLKKLAGHLMIWSRKDLRTKEGRRALASAGGKARSNTLSKARRQEIARMGVAARAAKKAADDKSA